MPRSLHIVERIDPPRRKRAARGRSVAGKAHPSSQHPGSVELGAAEANRSDRGGVSVGVSVSPPSRSDYRGHGGGGG